MSALLQENSPLIPKAHEIALAEQSSKELAALFPKREKDFHMVVKVDKREAKITFPFWESVRAYVQPSTGAFSNQFLEGMKQLYELEPFIKVKPYLTNQWEKNNSKIKMAS
jgi:hypothetical protein